METYQPNSNKFKKEQQEGKRKPEKIVNGTVKVKKKNEIQKVANAVVTEDISKVKEYAVREVIIPSLQKAIVDIIKNGIDILVYGESGGRRNESSKVSYTSYYNRDRRSVEPRGRSGFDYDDIIFDNRGDAEEVLIGLEDYIEEYGSASVNDLYDLVGISAPYTSNNYGWRNLRMAKVVRVSNGYMLKMPRTESLR